MWTLCSSPSTIRIPSPVVRLKFKGNRACLGLLIRGLEPWGPGDNTFPSARLPGKKLQGLGPRREGSQACGRLTANCCREMPLRVRASSAKGGAPFTAQEGGLQG